MVPRPSSRERLSLASSCSCFAPRYRRRRTNQALLSATTIKKLMRLGLSAVAEGWLGRSLLVLAWWSLGPSPSRCSRRWSSRTTTTRYGQQQTNQALLSATTIKKLIRLRLSAVVECCLGRSWLVLAWCSLGPSPSRCCRRWQQISREQASWEWLVATNK